MKCVKLPSSNIFTINLELVSIFINFAGHMKIISPLSESREKDLLTNEKALLNGGFATIVSNVSSKGSSKKSQYLIFCLSENSKIGISSLSISQHTIG